MNTKMQQTRLKIFVAGIFLFPLACSKTLYFFTDFSTTGSYFGAQHLVSFQFDYFVYMRGRSTFNRIICQCWLEF